LDNPFVINKIVKIIVVGLHLVDFLNIGQVTNIMVILVPSFTIKIVVNNKEMVIKWNFSYQLVLFANGKIQNLLFQQNFSYENHKLQLILVENYHKEKQMHLFAP